MPPWRAPEVDGEETRRLAAALNIRPLTARILLARGFRAPDLVRRFLEPRLANLRTPESIADLPRAVERLGLAVARGERIGIFGDYDVDGVTTAAILTLALRELGADVVPRVAKRFSGYGFSPEEAEILGQAGCTLILTGDCGTSDHQALGRCRTAGIDVIVIDHHQVPAGECLAFALINPHRADDGFPFKGLSSCGVAFYLAAALRSRLRAQAHPRAAAFDPRRLLDLVALGTLADLVPLTDENRILVAAGLRCLSEWQRPGLRALARLAELEPTGRVDVRDVTFRLTPRLNAPGRLGEAQVALELLLCAAEEEAERQAAIIDEINQRRQVIQEKVWTEALAEAESLGDAAAIVVGRQGWHPGVVGIVAAKLVERLGRPAVVVAFDGETGRGSARTTGGFNLHAALVACTRHLLVHGGHAAAAGLTVSSQSFPAFREAFSALAAEHAGRAGVVAATAVDAAVTLPEIDLCQVEELERLAPFGSANGQPLLALRGVRVCATRVVGNGHLQLTVSDGGAVADAIAFGMGTRVLSDGAAVDLVANAEIDSFRGFRRPRLNVRDIFPSEN